MYLKSDPAIELSASRWVLQTTGCVDTDVGVMAHLSIRHIRVRSWTFAEVSRVADLPFRFIDVRRFRLTIFPSGVRTCSAKIVCSSVYRNASNLPANRLHRTV